MQTLLCCLLIFAISQTCNSKPCNQNLSCVFDIALFHVYNDCFMTAICTQVVEDYLHKEYDLPTWGIFAIIACATLIAGLALGGVSVCVDCYMYIMYQSSVVCVLYISYMCFHLHHLHVHVLLLHYYRYS